MPKIKLAEIKPPTWYIRHRLSQDHFKDLLSVAKDSPKWPFPPVLLSSLSKEELESNKKSKKLGGFKYEATDGWHRINVAAALKMESIDATVSSPNTPKERFILQYQTNAFQGLRLDRDSRDDAIRHMRKEFKMAERAIAKEVGLSQMSVNRIIKNRQRGNKAKAEREAAREAFIDSPAEIATRLQTTLQNILELAPDFESYFEKGLDDNSIPERVIDEIEKNLLKVLEIVKAIKS